MTYSAENNEKSILFMPIYFCQWIEHAYTSINNNYLTYSLATSLETPKTALFDKFFMT